MRVPNAVSRAWTRLLRAWSIFDRINGALWASSFSYYAFFALFPLLAFLVSCAAHFTDAHTAFHRISEFAGGFMPLDAKDQAAVRHTVDGVFTARGQVGLIALLGLFWSSIGFFQAAVGAVNAAWGQPTLNWWHLPLKNLLMLTVLSSAVMLGIIFLSVLKAVSSLNSLWTPWPLPLIHFAHIMIASIVLFYGFLFFYRFAPRNTARVAFADVWLPALLVDALIQVAQYLFFYYATTFGNFNAIYGTFGVVIALMLWIYLSGFLIVFGGCLCAAIGEKRNSPGEKSATSANPATDARVK